MTRIYAFKTATWGRDVVSEAITHVDGEWVQVGQHLSSSVAFAQLDIARPGRYDEQFPEGWSVEWVTDPKAHPVIGHLFTEEEEMTP